MPIQRTAQIAIALLVVAAFALGVSNTVSSDDECEFGRVDPDNPLNTTCRAVPESLGAVSIQFGIVADFDDAGTPRCSQSNRFVFANERLNQDLPREVTVDWNRWADTIDNLSFHRMLGIPKNSRDSLLKIWNPDDLVNRLPDIPSNAARPSRDGVVIDGVVNITVYDDYVMVESDPIPAAAFEFNWRAALVACAQQHQQMEKEAEAKKAILLDRQASDAATATHQFIADSEVRIAQAAIDHYTAEIGKLEVALAKLEATLSEARILYQDALAKQRRTIELRTRMTAGNGGLLRGQGKGIPSLWRMGGPATCRSEL